MCPNTLKKRKLNPLVESFGTKQSCKSSYTILKGPSKERCGERAKAKINASQFKITFVLGCKSSTKGGDKP